MTTKDFKAKVLSLSDRIYPMVRRMLGNDASAEDAVQEILIKLWDRRRKLEKHPNIQGFVFLTARNYCLDILKKKKPKFDTAEAHLKMLVADSDQDQTEFQELTMIIETLLKDLPPQQAEVMMMRDIDGFEFKEIAAAMELKIAHVRVLASRARKQVGIQLKKLYSYEYRKT